MPVSQARRDLREKLVFERQLIKRLKKFSRSMARGLVRKYADGRQFITAESFRPELEDILMTHYKRVGKEFSNRLTESMPSDIAVTKDERAKIDGALDLYYIAQSGEQSNLITKTTQKDIEASFAEAIEELTQAESQKALFGAKEISVIAAMRLIRKLLPRNESIAAYETQVIAEAAKGTEGQILSGNDPSVLSGNNRPSRSKKEWVSMGDQDVRSSHIEADGQVVDETQPFTVDGESLMWPGDMSLGASIGNTINCRCASVIDKETVYAERRDSQELLQSIGSQL